MKLNLIFRGDFFNYYLRMSTTKVFTSRDITENKSLLDYLNGNGQFYIQNPYFKNENLRDVVCTQDQFLNVVKIGSTIAGKQIKAPKIYAMIGKEFKTNFIFQLDSGYPKKFDVGVKLYKPYNKDPNKTIDLSKNANYKAYTTFKFIDDENKGQNPLEEYSLLMYQLSQAMELLIICKIIHFDISSYTTDAKLFAELCSVLNISDKFQVELIKKYVDRIKNCTLPIYASQGDEYTDIEESSLLALLGQSLSSYVKNSISLGKDIQEKEKIKKEKFDMPLFEWFGKTIDSIKPAIRKHHYKVDTREGFNFIGDLTFSFTEKFPTNVKYNTNKTRVMNSDLYTELSSDGKNLSARIYANMRFDFRVYQQKVFTLGLFVRECGFKDREGYKQNNFLSDDLFATNENESKDEQMIGTTYSGDESNDEN